MYTSARLKIRMYVWLFEYCLRACECANVWACERANVNSISQIPVAVVYAAFIQLLVATLLVRMHVSMCLCMYVCVFTGSVRLRACAWVWLSLCMCVRLCWYACVQFFEFASQNCQLPPAACHLLTRHFHFLPLFVSICFFALAFGKFNFPSFVNNCSCYNFSFYNS